MSCASHLQNIVVPVSTLQRVLDEQTLPSDWLAVIVDKSGKIVARRPGGEKYAGVELHAELILRGRCRWSGFSSLRIGPSVSGKQEQREPCEVRHHKPCRHQVGHP